MLPSDDVLDYAGQIHETDLYVLNNTAYHADIKSHGEEMFTDVI